MIRAIRFICAFLLLLAAAVYEGVTFYEDYTADTTGPKITMEESEVTVSVADGEQAVLSGVTAEDGRDGDVTEYLVVESMSNFISGFTRNVTIVAFDEAGNVARTTRQVTYSDYTSPSLSLSGPLEAPVSDTSALLDVITVTDCLDGDLTDQVQVVFDVTNQSVEAGDIAMHIQVSNSAGDTLDLPVTVRFYDAALEESAPKLTLTDYAVYLETGSDFDPADYLNTLTVGTEVYNWNKSANQMESRAASLAAETEEDALEDDETLTEGGENPEAGENTLEGEEGTLTSDGDNPVAGNSEEEESALAGEDGTLTTDAGTSGSGGALLDAIPLSALTITSNVDTGTAGVYEVTYSYEDEEGVEGATRLVVIVEES